MRRKAACRTARRRLGLPPLAAPVLVFSLASWPALAQEPFSLKLSRELSPRPATVTVLADRAELSATGISTMSGNVEVRSGDRRIIADSARYDATTGLFDVAGHVQLMDNNVEIAGDLAQFDTPSGAGAFTDATFRLTSGFGRGTAASISTPGDQSLELEDVRYSTCPVDNDDWVLEAPFTRLDKENGVGYARSVRVEFKGVPILYAPFLSFPVSDQRKSGFLMPQIGNSQRNGIDVELPYYFNIAPNFDYTLTPRLLTRRGLQVKNSLRYLLPRSDGNLFVEYLPSDSVANRDRGYARLAHTTRFASGWRLIADASHVTDTRYFEDLGSSLAANSLTHTERRFDALYRSEHWLLRGRVQGFQTLDRNLTADQEPYASLPQLFALGRWRDGLAGLTWEWESELVSFYRATGVTGERLDLKPSVSLPIVTPGISVEPSVTLQHTQYSLRDTEAGADRSPSRTAPIYSVDSRAVFERAAGSRGQLLQTLEPRVRYIHIPFRNQDALPVFDTGEVDVNLDQIFLDDRFTGADRLGDTDQVSVALTTRVIDLGSAREFLTATIGQTLFLSDREVSLPGSSTDADNVSNLIAEVGLSLTNEWNADLEYQWDPNDSNTAKAAVRFQYRPAADRVLNLRYRFRRNQLEESDISFAWPVTGNWNVVGRWNYSLADESTLERFAGIEYDSCCWAARLVSRSFISTRDGQRESALFAQIELKGLASVGARADTLLERGILGYTD